MEYTGLKRIETPYGHCERRHQRFDDPELDNEYQALPPLLFLDLESTGFGRDDAWIFLIGLGWLEEKEFWVEQLLAPDQDAEPALLWCFNQQINPGRYLVTYNGRSFDLPRLRSRLKLYRLEYDLTQSPHLDLYQVARKFLKPRQGFRLTNIEQEFLRRYRANDLPSRAMPAAYQEWLYSGGEEPLARLLKHNQEDIRSLAHLFFYLLGHFELKLL
jgi:hypothetical protein